MILYLGLDPSRYPCRGKQLWHYPLIRTEKLVSPQIAEARLFWVKCSHAIFTSRSAVSYWFEEVSPGDHHVVAVGKATAVALQEKGIFPQVAKEETQEGVIACLQEMDPSQLFWPRSQKARPLLENYLQERGFPYMALDLYTTVFLLPPLIEDWSGIQEIVFTSPSTVQAFFAIYPSIPQGVEVVAIGPVTKQALIDLFRNSIWL
jgi:uroporphyrinogen-III synthase